MSKQLTFADTSNVTSSPVSASGPTLSEAQDGPMVGQSGREAARANRSAPQDRDKALQMIATSGQTSFGSSASVALTLSLASKWQAQTASNGSMLYRMTWKARATPAGRLIPALRASVRRKAAPPGHKRPAQTAQPIGSAQQLLGA